ncbi:hypothetical protein SAMN04488007_3703 [Maribacter aquivivus]|uniref:TonB protein C-terminal n=1 Tax=Maribacter aquivivus TaxID=228958 RepID=A0A1M6UVC1_9FLAO|nr:hypothetical protein [Maribacter aquivivus]SHK73182.1 hypothetical protein SAMN04488007_3703 [Maribacter aquivivus]
MKNKLNILLLTSLLIAAAVIIWLYYQTTNNVGDIDFDSSIDNSEFVVCNEEYIVQYYSAGTYYEGGKKAIKKELRELITHLDFEKSGIITFRFIVNCKNQTGRFRIKMVNTDLKETSFNSSNIKQIQESIKNLKDWHAGKWNNQPLDTYYNLSFKIQDGKITDIF